MVVLAISEFTATVFKLEYKVFIVYITAVSVDSTYEVYSSKKTQMTYLKVDKTFSKVSSKYANFENIFSPKLIIELPKLIRINNHIIKSIDN